MSDPSLPWGWLARPPTEGERAYQDVQLQPYISLAWASGLIDEFRADARPVHQYLAGLGAQALRVPAGSPESARAADRYVAEYEHLVLAMATAGDDRLLIPVDMWADHLADTLPVYTHKERTTYVFNGLLNVALRMDVGLFTRQRLLLNRHYTLMLAHLVAHPARIERARDLPRPYPWPFVIRLDRERTPQLDPQQDMTKPLEGLARRIRKALQGCFRQAGRAPYGTLPKAQEQSARAAETRTMKPARAAETRMMKPARRKLAEAAVDLLETYPGATWHYILECDEFKDAQRLTDITIANIWQLRRLVIELKGANWRKPRGSV